MASLTPPHLQQGSSTCSPLSSLDILPCLGFHNITTFQFSYLLLTTLLQHFLKNWKYFFLIIKTKYSHLKKYFPSLFLLALCGLFPSDTGVTQVSTLSSLLIPHVLPWGIWYANVLKPKSPALPLSCLYIYHFKNSYSSKQQT